MSKIYELPLSFRLVKKYVRFTFKQFYGKFIILGKENIPKQGPVIFAPNHLNALMDALAVHTVTPDNYATIFLGRADMFKKKTTANFLRWAKLMPAFRIRDGIENLGRNTEIFDQCVEVLENYHAMGIMPEGNQELERKIRPLVKGIFRIAFSAQQKMGIAKNIKIIPIGIEYDDFIKFGKNIIINIGQAIEIQEYMELYSHNPVNAINEIKNRLKTDLENLTVHLDTKNFYNCFVTSVYVANEAMLHKMGLEDNIVNRFAARREIGKVLMETEINSIDKIQQLNELCAELNKKLKTLNFRVSDITNEPKHRITNTLKSLTLLLTLPIFIIGFVFNFLPFFTPVLIRKSLKVQFPGFISSLQYVLGLLTFPLFYLLQTIIVLIIIGQPWWLGILLIPLQYLTGKFAFFGWYKNFMKLIFDFKILKIHKLYPEKLKSLLDLSNKITEIIVA